MPAWCSVNLARKVSDVDLCPAYSCRPFPTATASHRHALAAEGFLATSFSFTASLRNCFAI